MFNINWKNTAENLALAMLFLIAGAIIGYTASIKTAKATASQILEANNQVIMEAIKKETTSIKNEISNSFETNIQKQKVKGGSQNETTTSPILDNTSTMDVEWMELKENKEVIPPRPSGIGKWKQKKEWDKKYGNK